ncbi:MAG: cardiolipin synthase [Clostridia bacterium]|nr:cardiolipin synthase [Clostridia bacterium]
MKKTYSYKLGAKTIERQYSYIPFRYIRAFMLSALMTLSIIAVVIAMCYYVPYFYACAMITQFFCVLKIISSDDNPDYKVPWLLFVLILPVVGFMLYFLFYSRKIKNKYVKRMEYIKNKYYSVNQDELFNYMKMENITAYNQAKMLCNIADAGLFRNTKVKYFPLGEEMMPAMLEDIENAKKFIYLEYFIIEQGVFWDSIHNRLIQKVKEGVEVKLCYDDIGCMTKLPGDFAKTLTKEGIDAVPFARLRGTADSEFNNRSHRKLLIIDGYIGYTGGINVADEYINVGSKFGHWKDTGVRLEGEAVWEMTELFLFDYGMNTKKVPKFSDELYPEHKTEGMGYVACFGDGPAPMFERRVGKSVIQNMLASSKNYVWMTTPYLIIDNDLCQSIECCALRGVDVRIIVPHVPDKKIVFEITKSFYSRLIKAGVKIYEYTPGFIHAKSYLADDEYAMIGTINLDYRSLVHHFENGVWMYRTDAIPSIKADLEETIAKSEQIKQENIKVGSFKKFIRAVVRIFAPLL